MSFCSNCGNPVQPDSKFCANCGAVVSEVNMAPVAPAAPVVVEPAPQVVCGEPVCPTNARVLGFVGMGLSIGGVVMAAIFLLYTIVFMGIDGETAFGASLIYGMISMPLSIVGGVLSDKGRNMGNRSAVCSVSSKLRIAGIIVTAVMLFVGLIGLVS